MCRPLAYFSIRNNDHCLFESIYGILVVLCMCVRQRTVNFAQRMKKKNYDQIDIFCLRTEFCVWAYFSYFSQLRSSVLSFNSQSKLLSIFPSGFESCLQQFVSFILFLDLFVVFSFLHCILYSFLWMLLNGKCTTRACL